MYFHFPVLPLYVNEKELAFIGMRHVLLDFSPKVHCVLCVVYALFKEAVLY